MKVEQKYDAIVIGSGPGGATVARELSANNKKVLILEWGPDPVITGKLSQYARLQLNPLRTLLITSDYLAMVRGVITGGSTCFYYGTYFPVPIDLLKKYGVDLTKEVEEVRKELPCKKLKDDMITPMTNKIMKSAQKLGYDWQRFEKLMYQDRWTPETKFGYFGYTDNDLRWGAKVYIREAQENGATILNNAKVKKVIIEDGAAKGVEFRKDGKTQKAFADQIIVSAGGIGSPLILRNSGIKEAGNNYFFDPLVTVSGVVEDVKAGNEIPMSTGVHLKENGYMMTDCSIPPAVDMMWAAAVLRFDRMFAQKKTLRIMVKVRDELGGRISNSGQIRKKMSKEDKRKLKEGAAKAKEILKNAGAKKIFKSRPLAAHPGGTVKIGELLDSNLKTEYDNLYVCDCSVIPEPWGLPPTVTLVCLGKRLAKHLAGTKVVEKELCQVD